MKELPSTSDGKEVDVKVISSTPALTLHQYVDSSERPVDQAGLQAWLIATDLFLGGTWIIALSCRIKALHGWKEPGYLYVRNETDTSSATEAT